MPTTAELYERLVLADCRNYIPGLKSHESFTDEECKDLLWQASFLALRSDGSHDGAVAGRQSYDIATRLPNFSNGTRPQIEAASDYILTQLGNFPARTLMRADERSVDHVARLNPHLALAILGRESDNLEDESEPLLTDFQVRLLAALKQSKSVSFSAPTSAGKSTALEFEIVRRLKNPPQTLALLVPTRALIRQATFDLVALLKDAALNHIPVISTPDPTQFQQRQNIVCVFTQERLQTLLSDPNWKGTIDCLFVDEAQEIGQEDRGQTLELTILQVVKAYPQCTVVFSSPLRSNPEYLLATVDRTLESIAFVEHSAPVTQNIFLMRRERGKPKRANVSAWFDGKERSLGAIDLPFKFRGGLQLGDWALHLTEKHESSIVYAGWPAKAQDLAEHIADQLPDAPTEGTEQLSSFISDEIHKDYLLGSVISRSVGFHYGRLPQIIRSKIEDLLRDREMRFVCCTSTLLQGVNLPAKNIFVENPKKGPGQPMQPGDFWNLVGRAGRLAKEFQGNVFCIFGDPWEAEPFGSTRFYPLTSAFAEVTANRVEALLEVAEHPPESSEKLQWAEQAVARIHTQFAENGQRISESRFATADNRSGLIALDDYCSTFSKQKTLSPDSYRRNPYVLPSRLDKLAEFFRTQSNILQWVAPLPFAPKAYFRYLPIFQLLDDQFLRTGNEKRTKYFTVLALQWMTGNSLKQLIKNRIEFYQIEARDKKGINKHIRELFENIEDELRYTYVKYLRLYSDVLREVLIERKETDAAESIPPLHLFLEYGAANKTLINLMALGLSRTSAILLKNALDLRDDVSATECQERINASASRLGTLPALCAAEIRRLQRT